MLLWLIFPTLSIPFSEAKPDELNWVGLLLTDNPKRRWLENDYWQVIEYNCVIWGSSLRMGGDEDRNGHQTKERKCPKELKVSFLNSRLGHRCAAWELGFEICWCQRWVHVLPETSLLPLTCTVRDNFLKKMKEVALETREYAVHMRTVAVFMAIWSLPGTVVNFPIQ